MPAVRSDPRMFSRNFSGISCALASCSPLTGCLRRRRRELCRDPHRIVSLRRDPHGAEPTSSRPRARPAWTMGTGAVRSDPTSGSTPVGRRRGRRAGRARRAPATAIAASCSTLVPCSSVQVGYDCDQRPGHDQQGEGVVHALITIAPLAAEVVAFRPVGDSCRGACSRGRRNRPRSVPRRPLRGT